MKRPTQAALTLALLLAPGPLARAAEPTEQAIRAIHRLSGTVFLDEKSAARPGIEVNVDCSPGVDDAALAQLRGLTGLRVLHLAFTPVTDAGLEDLKGLKDLRILDLDYTRGTDRGIDALREALPGVDGAGRWQRAGPGRWTGRSRRRFWAGRRGRPLRDESTPLTAVLQRTFGADEIDAAKRLGLTTRQVEHARVRHRRSQG
jgi:hypothetical protein